MYEQSKDNDDDRTFRMPRAFVAKTLEYSNRNSQGFGPWAALSFRNVVMIDIVHRARYKRASPHSTLMI